MSYKLRHTFGEGFGKHVHYYVNGVCRCGKKDNSNGKSPAWKEATP